MRYGIPFDLLLILFTAFTSMYYLVSYVSLSDLKLYSSEYVFIQSPRKNLVKKTYMSVEACAQTRSDVRNCISLNPSRLRVEAMPIIIIIDHSGFVN